MFDLNAFTGARLDRASDGRRRGDAWLAAQQADPRARVLVAGTAGVAMSGGRLSYLPLGSAPSGIEPPVLLGIDREGPLFAVDEGPAVAPATRPPLIGWQDRLGDTAAVPKGRLGLREAVAALPQGQGGTIAYAAGLLNWHRHHRFCSVCGTPTVARDPALRPLRHRSSSAS